jgi:hypothetical protein
MKNEKSVYFIGGGVTLDFRIVEDNLYSFIFLVLKQKNKSTPMVYISNTLIKMLKIYFYRYHFCIDKITQKTSFVNKKMNKILIFFKIFYKPLFLRLFFFNTFITKWTIFKKHFNNTP